MAGPSLSGILTPNIVPLDRQGRIDEDKLRGYVDWLIERGVDGLYPNGSTGEFTRYTPEERQRTVAIMVDQANGRVPILAGAAEANVDETIRACEAYGEMGARAVAIVAPFYYRLTPDAVYEYFKAIATQVTVDVTLYNIPLFASPIDVPTVQRLAMECPRVVGIKDSSGDLPHMMRMIAAVRPQRPEFSFLTGWDAALAPMLFAGADGGTLASSGIVPELTGAIYKAVRAGKYDESIRMQYQLLPFFDTMIQTTEFPEGFRRGLKARGWDMGASRQPLSAAQLQFADTTEAKLRDLVVELGKSLPLKTSMPTVSHAAVSLSSNSGLNSDLDSQAIDRIVRQVVQKLGL